MHIVHLKKQIVLVTQRFVICSKIAQQNGPCYYYNGNSLCVQETKRTGEGDYVDAFVQKFELDESAILEASLCDKSKFVAFITKKFQIENYMPIILYSDYL